MSDLWQINALILVVSLLILLSAGVWIPIALGLVGLTFIMLADGFEGLSALGSLTFNNVNSMTLTAVPLFVLMGELVLHSNIMSGFYRSLSMWLRWLPGSLLHSQIAATSVMAAVTGSSVATAGAIGASSVPTLKGYGYDRRRIYGALAAGGTLGILIPPSIIMIVYGALTQQSVAKLFVAAMVPGALLTLLFMAYILVQELASGQKSPRSPATGWAEKGRALKDLVPITALLAAIIYSIYTGVVTPTEAGALGSVATLLLLAAYRSLSGDVLIRAIRGTIYLSGMVLAIVMAASIYSFALVRGGINRGVTQWIADAGFSTTGVLIATALLLLLLGMFIDGISIVYLALPVLVPVMVAQDVNLIWFGVFVTILIEVGLITPPLGLNLYVIKGIDPTATITEVARGAMPYILLMLGLLGVLMAWPDIALFLVNESGA